MKLLKHSHLILILLATLLLSACSMIPPKEPQHLSKLTIKQLSIDKNQLSQLSPQWWLQFNDPQLTHLIESGLKQNLSLIDVKNQLALANAQVSLTETGNNPKINLTASAGGIGAGTSFNPSDTNTSGLVMLLPSISYQLDFWGKNKTAINLATDQKLSLKAQQAQVRLIVSASIAQSYFSYQGNSHVEKTLDLLINNMDAQNKVLETQIKRGLVSKTAVYQNDGELENLKTKLASAKMAQVLAQNQLALYLGKTPAQLSIQLSANAQQIQQLNNMTTIPMNLLAHRPDVVVSQWLVEANQEGITMAKKAYYPDFNLMAFGVLQQLTSLNPAQLLLGGATIGTTLPIYDGGVRDSKYRSANIRYDQAVNHYNQTVLTAVKQTSDAITRVASAQEQQKLLLSSADKYRQAYEILDHGYQRGLVNYSAMNSARLQWHQQEIKQTQSNSAVLQQQLQLIVALGGGYQAATGKASPESATQLPASN